MSKDYNDLIIGLKDKITRVILKNEDEKQKNNLLLAENNELRNELETKKEELKQLKNKYAKLELTKAFLSSSENEHDAKIKINGIVREIDNCIALLNR